MSTIQSLFYKITELCTVQCVLSVEEADPAGSPGGGRGALHLFRDATHGNFRLRLWRNQHVCTYIID
jgi:hypothetical protein